MKDVSFQMKGPPHTSKRMKTDLHGGNPYDISKHRRQREDSTDSTAYTEVSKKAQETEWHGMSHNTRCQNRRPSKFWGKITVNLISMPSKTTNRAWKLNKDMFRYAMQKNVASRRPWWCSGWESACRCRRHGFEPWSGKIPHAAEQLSPCATTTEPMRHNYWSPQA